MDLKLLRLKLPARLSVAALLLVSVVAAKSQAHEQAEIKAGDALVVDAYSGLNLRPHPNSGKVGVIPNGHVMYATGPAKLHETGRYSSANKYWAPVKYQNESGDWMSGWVLLRYANVVVAPTAPVTVGSATPALNPPLIENDPESPSIVTQVADPAINDASEAPADKFLMSVKVNTRARIRSGPGLSNAILGRYSNGTKVRVIGKPVSNWVPIQIEGTEEKGWMHVSLLETEGNLNPLEVARLHPVGSEDVDKRIDEYAQSKATEAGTGATCDGSPECLARNLERIDVTSANGYVRPVPGTIRSRFGRRTDPITGAPGSQHNGTDFTAPTGTPVRAIKAGRVISVETQCPAGRNKSCGGGWGNFVTIDHGNGITSVYAHLSSVKMQPGDRVDASTLIGESGNSGRSTGPHFHLEVHVNGVKKNPLNYIPN